jgi:excisionase family DNA binding protein
MNPRTSTPAPAENRPAGLLKSKQAAEWLNISQRHLSDLTRTGRIPAVRIGKKAVRYAEADLSRFVAQCRDSQ